MAAVAQPPSTNIITRRVVIERSGRHWLYLMPMYSHMTIDVLKERVLALYHRGQPWWSRWLCRPAIGIVTIVRSIDSEFNLNDEQQVFVTSDCPSSFDPATFRTLVVGFSSTLGATSPPKAILLHPKFSSFGLSLATVAVLAAIVAPGLLVGVMVGQAELGITLSAAIAGTFALAENLRGQTGHAQ